MFCGVKCRDQLESKSSGERISYKMMFPVFSVLLLVINQLFCFVSGAEFFSSIHEMTKVFGYEQKLLLHMQKFLGDNQEKLDFLKARLREFENERNEAREWGPAYFDSPINKYLLNKRLTVDWQRVENLMDASTGEKSLKRLRKLRNLKIMPNKKELEGAIDGVLRLQYVYRLEAKDLARGILDGVNYGNQLNSELCVDIARLALRDQHPRLAHSWLIEANGRLTGGEKEKELRPQILALLVQAKAELEDFRGLNDTYQELLKIQPASEQHAKNYESFLESLGEKALLNDSKPILEHAPIPEEGETVGEFQGYSLTCSGHWQLTPKEQRNLRCGYVTETHPFLWIAPLKAEELFHDPLLVLYHDVIYQSEIDVIRKLTNNRLSRARVTSHNESVVSNVRTSQFTFIPVTEHKVLATIDQRVADMTNMNMKYAEDHQFANYGIGGHYGQHMDWFSQTSVDAGLVSSPEMGNRIATVLFYLSDVAQGGGTAFPQLRQHLKPKKYAAAFWHNLHASGVGDVRTQHGACPIIAGSKWVQNRWIREIDQSDRRPCELWDDSLATYAQLLEAK
ncbi:LOW QUALITY PROTEIN: prolyl 4-hydroxylase subunit alpha-2 [Drosophila rhopaloa]|uniref:procollagen-proline 4-dioxygenase n=1 Tax=Drosophila rhopaloa TaxID=1041015 RepID=A0ABM5HI37_DRORH|nr:LOW QUALITY PROTEIN: prolyl 4-hydroxylase subunit alpha-2 [Drosophila rhopaloa]